MSAAKHHSPRTGAVARSALCVGLLSLAALALGPAADAAPGTSTDWRPSPSAHDGSGGLQLVHPFTGGKGSAYLGGFMTAAERLDAPVSLRRQSSVHLGGGWALADWLRLEADLPFVSARMVDDDVVAGLGDAQLSATVPFLSARPGGFGIGIHTALARIAGRPVGLMANNPLHLGGAIDADAADKAARFMQLCNAHALPIVSLVDTPGFMVGPDTEATAQVRHVSRLFVAAAHLRVPLLSVVLRKGYGLGAMAMTGGGFHETLATVAWPTGEFGGMGLEGAVRLGYRKELEALPEGPEREALFEQLLAQQYDNGSAINMATTLEIDAVIDPAETRNWLVAGLASGQTRPFDGTLAIDTW